MADLAIGISKAAVQLLADKVKSAIREEAQQWQIVQRDLVFITGEFEMMQSFLDTATEERVRNNVVMRMWVRQVRDLSYDVEDCIDLVLQLGTKRSWWPRRLLPSCKAGGAALALDEAVAEITLLKARVVDVSQRNLRYSLIVVDSGSRPIDHQVENTSAARISSFDSRLINIINAVKKSGPFDLTGLITRNDKDLQVMSVCGPEGNLGKVAIIRKVYSDSRIYETFECRAWVKLMYPFNPREIIRSLMVQFYTHSRQEQAELEIPGLDALTRMRDDTHGDLVKEFTQKVNTQRYLIVLEDLDIMVQWDAIRSFLPDRKKGSRIVVLTHQPVIASLCTGEPCRVSELGQFSPDCSDCVYFKESFRQDRVHSFIKEEPYNSLCSYGLLGRDSEVNELSEQTKERRLISVWGMPGVGKSVLVGSIYCKPRTSDYSRKHAWVSVSHPFNPTDVSRSLLLQLHSESTSSEGRYSRALRAKDPIKECRDLLHEYVYLVVIDDVQSKEDWDWIKSNLIEYGNSRSCIIVVTSEESVAKHCAVSCSDALVYNIKGLEPDPALQLFKKVLEENGRYLDDDVPTKYAAKLILSKCGGLPKLIVALARYLVTKPADVLKQEMRCLSDNFMHELATNPEFDSVKGLLSWMRSYLHACPRHLKACMLYLSIFPQDVIIRPSRLVRRWIAEGYSKGTDNNSMLGYANKIFEEIAALSIMQPATMSAGGYRVNGFFREYVISRPVEETIFFPAQVSALESGYGPLSTQGVGQHLAVGRTWKIDLVSFESLDLSRLRSLTVFGGFVPFYVSDRMRVLRVLDLENTRVPVNYAIDEIGKLTPRLKFLSLRGQRDISRLPDSVGDLMQLQTLDIRDTSIVNLPPCIIRLQKLQYIRAGATRAWLAAEEQSTTPSSGSSGTLAPCFPRFCRREPDGSTLTGGVVVPRGIARLKALQTLGDVRVNTADGDATLREIYFLSRCHLEKLEMSGINSKYTELYFRILCFADHLESLSLQFEMNSQDVDWGHICPPYSLRSLKMYGYAGQVPPLIKLLGNLMKMTLEMTRLFTAEDIKVLGCVPNLRTLRLRVNNDQDGELHFPAALFRKLEVLEIACRSRLHMRFDEGAMEKLEQLKVHCLGESELQFSGLENPVCLKQLWLLGSFDDALKETLQQQLDRHPKKPALKLEVEARSSQASTS